MKTKVCIVVGTRPNIIKALPLYLALEKSEKFTPVVLHTGQHYDSSLSREVIKSVGLPIDYKCNAKTSNRDILTEVIYNKLKKINCDIVIVLGDVNSTLAAAIATKKLGKTLVHVEAGLRSNNWVMEEEYNRYLTDCLSNLLFVTEPIGVTNLKKELNLKNKKVHIVGNIMMDTLLHFKSQIFVKKDPIHIVATFHRKENIENRGVLHKIENLMGYYTNGSTPRIAIFAHPNLMRLSCYSYLHPPLPYLKFLQEVYNSAFVITDSCGVAEDAVFMGKNVVIYRNEFEEPTILKQNNVLLSTDRNEIITFIKETKVSPSQINQNLHNTFWGDGNVSTRVVAHMENYCG